MKITAAARLWPSSAVAKSTVNGSTASKRARVSALAIGRSNAPILPVAGPNAVRPRFEAELAKNAEPRLADVLVWVGTEPSGRAQLPCPECGGDLTEPATNAVTAPRVLRCLGTGRARRRRTPTRCARGPAGFTLSIDNHYRP